MTVKDVESSDGTSEISNYNSNGPNTTTYYSSPNGTGTITKTDVENSNGTSVITNDNPDGSSTEIQYAGPNGTGVVTETVQKDKAGNVLITIPDSQSGSVPNGSSSNLEYVSVGNGSTLNVGSSGFSGVVTGNGVYTVSMDGYWTGQVYPVNGYPIATLENITTGSITGTINVAGIVDGSHPLDVFPDTDISQYVPPSGQFYVFYVLSPSTGALMGTEFVVNPAPLSQYVTDQTLTLGQNVSGQDYQLDDVADVLQANTNNAVSGVVITKLILTGSASYGTLTKTINIPEFDITGATDPELTLQGGSINSDAVAIDEFSTVSGSGQIAGLDRPTALTDDGTLAPSAGTLTVAGAIGGIGNIDIGPTGSLILNGTLNHGAGDKVTIGFDGIGGSFTINDNGYDTVYIKGDDGTSSGTISGGNGTNIASFSVSMSDAQITRNADGSVSISDPTDGTETFSNFALAEFTDGSVSLNGAPVCFREGTAILTAGGPVAVERLCSGDLIVTAHGEERPVKWLGHRSIDCRRHPRPTEVMPIRIAAHALGTNRPARDLYVSPGHAICIDVMGEMLVPAAALVNGSSIARVTVPTVTYWHVELDRHDVILAENLPCESYLEMGNRGFFDEAGVVALRAVPDAPIATHAAFCRPFHAGGPLVEAVRARLQAMSPRGATTRGLDQAVGLHG